jgi:hypothetical protein
VHSHLTVGDGSAAAASKAAQIVASAPREAYSRALRAAWAARRMAGGDAGDVKRPKASSSLRTTGSD